MEKEENSPHTKSRFIVWAKRLGIAGFLFFTIKGLLWLIVPAALIWFGTHQ
ncbi:MAG: hypothetical protein Q8R25_02245 [bacterium]|nr:hypothetical protein [bacterium]